MRTKKQTTRQTAKTELEKAQAVLHHARDCQIRCQTAATQATVALQEALMNYCDASEAVRHLSPKR